MKFKDIVKNAFSSNNVSLNEKLRAWMDREFVLQFYTKKGKIRKRFPKKIIFDFVIGFRIFSYRKCLPEINRLKKKVDFLINM